MYLSNGKFYENGVEVPMEHGNLTQIRLLKAAGFYNDPIEEANEDDSDAIDVEFNSEAIEWLYTASFQCKCGKKCTVEEGSDYENEDEELFENRELTCVCSRRYVLFVSYGSLKAKRLVNKSVKP